MKVNPVKKKKTHFYVQENTKDEASKNKCWKYFSQMVIDNWGVENPKPDKWKQWRDVQCIEWWETTDSLKFIKQINHVVPQGACAKESKLRMKTMTEDYSTLTAA